jgi:class 3 adenylate cyclase/predicted ATPase
VCDIREWLASLGLAEYADCFAQNRIDLSILPDLTDQDLKELGVVLGDRRRMLRAIAELAGTASAARPTAPFEPMLRDEAERRHVTVMFSDLVGSTALSTCMDPEDLRDVISAYQKCVAETAGRFGGFVARYMGDGVLVYFGYPQAHEDDAERAVRAGLELIATVAALKTRASLQTRVGIATGLVVVGHLLQSGEARERGMVGETPNLAARLQGLAEPNTIVIAENTRKLVGDLFDVRDIGRRDIKGIAEPVQAWAVLGVSSVASRFEAMHGRSLTAFVGRKEEADLLLRRWSKATTGKGQVVLLSGEAGIGKSRLIAAAMERLAGESHTRLRYFCYSQHTDSAFYPIISQIRYAAGLTREDTLPAKLDKLDALLAQTSTPPDHIAFIAEMLSLPNDGRYPSIELTPQQRRQKTLDALTFQLEALARSKPVLMIFEDVHWIDPTSLEALGRAVDRVGALPVLLVVTFRPEFEPSWSGSPSMTAIGLGRLGQGETEEMIDQLAGNKLLSASVRRDIIERTDGIPLFVEEMTKAVLEAGSQGASEQMAAAVPSPALAVPATLHASLMARLDRLGPAKELAQIGASIGRRFSHAFLAAVARKLDVDLADALDRLVGAGLLFRQGATPSTTYYSFKHALVRDAAYGTLLREPRRALHAQIAETFETHFAEVVENQPELLAHHCTEAGQIEKAAGLWGKAGQRSAQRSALVEAATQLRRALDQIASLPATPALRQEEIKLQVALISPLLPVKGYAAPETQAAVERARLLIERAEALGEPPEDPLLLFSVLYGFWVANYVAFNGDVMRELAAQFLALAGKQTATAPLMIGHRLMGLSLLMTGDIAESRTQFDKAIALYDPAEHRALSARFGQDVRMASLSLRSWGSSVLGFHDAALADIERALEDAREIGQAATSMYALLVASIMQLICGNCEKADALVDELIAVTDKTGSSFWGAWGIMQRGCVLVLCGKASDAVTTISSGLTAWRSTGSTAMIPWYLAYLAKAHAELGQFAEARRAIGEALTDVENTKERWCEAEVNRIAAEIELQAPQRDLLKVEAYLARALAVARQQQAKTWELRAALSTARLQRDRGRPQEAREVLDSVYGWFPQVFSSSDLKQSKALLYQLEQRGRELRIH